MNTLTAFEWIQLILSVSQTFLPLIQKILELTGVRQMVEPMVGAGALNTLAAAPAVPHAQQSLLQHLTAIELHAPITHPITQQHFDLMNLVMAKAGKANA